MKTIGRTSGSKARCCFGDAVQIVMERSLGEDVVVVFICGTPGHNAIQAMRVFLETTHGQESKPLFPLPLQIDFFVVFVSCVH